MALYNDIDISLNFSGDLKLNSKGDIQLADSLETYKSAANFILRTDYGEYAPNSAVGCNLGSFIGERNVAETHDHMKYSIFTNLVSNIFDQSDITVDVVPFDYNEAMCLIQIAGTYNISGKLVTVDGERMIYSFPYIDGNPDPITI